MNEAERIEMKHCIESAHEGENPLPLSEFYRSNRSKDGLQPYCKKCSTKRVVENRAKRHGVPAPDDYIFRHVKKRAQEAALADSLLSEKLRLNNDGYQDAFVFIERKPMFVGPVRQPSGKVFNWRVA